MPTYKQFKYYKIRDCPSCRFFKYNECHQPIPNDFNCNFITKKEFVHLYYFKTSILGRCFVRRGFATKEAAREAEIAFRKQSIDDNYIRSIRRLPTFKKMLKEYESFLKASHKETYATDLRRKIDNFYSTLLPDIPITKLLWKDAEAMRRKIDKLKITCKSKNRHLNFMIRFFDWIQKYYKYRYDAIYLLLPFKDYSIRRQKKKAKIVEFTDFLKIFKACEDPFYQLALLTLFIFGYRISELLALTPDSFDFNENTVEIYQAVSFKGGKGKNAFDLVTPKTPASERIQAMPNHYVNLIKKHIDIHHLKKKDFIFFRSEDNKNLPIHENSFRRQCEKYCRSFNKDFHPHMLRTSICTHLREKGVPLQEISAYLGHEDPAITEEYYSKTSNQKQEILNNVIDEFMKKIV